MVLVFQHPRPLGDAEHAPGHRNGCIFGGQGGLWRQSDPLGSDSSQHQEYGWSQPWQHTMAKRCLGRQGGTLD